MMTTSQRWMSAIHDACAEPDFALSNRLITQLHYFLSEALAAGLGRSGGPNFHSWAVWGSRKAGVTIRQEDLDDAIFNATFIASITGSLIGGITGIVAGRGFKRIPAFINATAGASAGALTGGWAGRQIAIWSRKKAAQLVLKGNQIVLQDIGEQSARFLELLEKGATPRGRQQFFAGLRPGCTERQGQDRLARAFRFYLAAFDSTDIETKRAAMIAGNCEIVYHEHIRLEPYIRGAMPWIVRRCTTRRSMSYEIGNKVFSVGENLPGNSLPTAAKNWANIEERMQYIFALFQQFHTSPEVFAAPYSSDEMKLPSALQKVLF